MKRLQASLIFFLDTPQQLMGVVTLESAVRSLPSARS